MKRLLNRLVCILHRVHPLLWIGLFLVSLEAFARAGGGGRYSGGGGSSGGGNGGGGDGLGVLLYLIFWLIRDHPAIGIPLAVVVIPTFIYLTYKSKEGATSYHQGRTIHRENMMRGDQVVAGGFHLITERDPAFAAEPFLERSKTAFLKLQHAWSNQDLRTIRPFVSDGILERFQLQIQEQQEDGIRDYMENIQILRSSIAQVESDPVFDTITVRIDASAVDYEVDLKTGKRVSGSKSSEPFTEYWSFIRRPGAQTKQENGLIEGNCPNCGAGLELNESAKCQACSSVIKSGEFDWVLSEITQAGEWQFRADNAVAGINEIRTSDPSFSTQQLEDRASVMFWRYVLSLRAGKTAPIRKMATDALCESLEKANRADANGVRTYPARCAVGAVDTLGIVVSEPMDKALVQIRWSGEQSSVDQHGKHTRLSNSRVSTEIFVLSRAHGVSAASSGGLSSAHCPGCGAPMSNEAADACEYCGKVLNDGQSDWVLEMIGSAYDLKIQELRANLQSSMQVAGPATSAGGPPPVPGPGGMEVMAWMITTMLADGIIDQKEQEMLNSYAAQRQIPQSQIDRMVHSCQSGTLETPSPKSADETQAWLAVMARMALADGFVSKEEEAALMQLGKALDYGAYDIKRIIKEQRRAMFQEAKHSLRGMKHSNA